MATEIWKWAENVHDLCGAANMKTHKTRGSSEDALGKLSQVH